MVKGWGGGLQCRGGKDQRRRLGALDGRGNGWLLPVPFARKLPDDNNYPAGSEWSLSWLPCLCPCPSPLPRPAFSTLPLPSNPNCRSMTAMSSPRSWTWTSRTAASSHRRRTRTCATSIDCTGVSCVGTRCAGEELAIRVQGQLATFVGRGGGSVHMWCCSAALAGQASLFSAVGGLRCTPAWRLHSPPCASLPVSHPCSVLVHSGGVHGGHYYAFIRPDGQKWIRFDDDRVELVDSNRAVDDQFGE